VLPCLSLDLGHLLLVLGGDLLFGNGDQIPETERCPEASDTSVRLLGPTPDRRLRTEAAPGVGHSKPDRSLRLQEDHVSGVEVLDPDHRGLGRSAEVARLSALEPAVLARHHFVQNRHLMRVVEDDDVTPGDLSLVSIGWRRYNREASKRHDSEGAESSAQDRPIEASSLVTHADLLVRHE